MPGVAGPEVLAPLAAGLSVALAGAALRFRRPPAVAAWLRALGSEAAGTSRHGREPWLVRLGRSPWASRLASPGLRARWEAAGGPGSPEALVGTKVALGAAVLGLALVGWGLVPAIGGLLVPCAPVLALAAFRAPDFLLARAGRRRRRELERQVPDLASLLVVGAEAGLSPPAAFRRAAQALAPPLGEEVRRAVSEIDLGLAWPDALQALVGRTGAPSLGRLVRALVRSHRSGVALTPALRAQSEELRAEQRARAEERARRAPVAMLFPLVFLILPAFLLLTVGPVLLATLRALR